MLWRLERDVKSNLPTKGPTCRQRDDLDDRLDDPGRAGRSGLRDTSGCN